MKFFLPLYLTNPDSSGILFAIFIYTILGDRVILSKELEEVNNGIQELHGRGGY